MSYLTNSIKRLFGGGYPVSYTSYLKLLVKVASSYADNDFGEREREALNKLNSVILKDEMISDMFGYIRDIVHGADKYDPAEIKRAMKNMSDLPEMIMNLDTSIDIAALVTYTKKKAIEAGDWPLKEE